MRISRLVQIAFVIAVGFLLVPPVRADKVYLRDRERPVEGEVIEENAEIVRVKVRYGEVTYNTDEVERIEYELTVEQRFMKNLDAAKTAGACLKLAEEAPPRITKSMKKAAWEKALSFDAGNRKAHELLGHLYDVATGRWLTTDEDKLKAGWVYFDGELMAPEKVEALRRKRRAEAARAAEERRHRYENELKGVSWGRAHRIETDHYIIKCNSSETVARRYSDFMETIYSAYDQVFKGYKRYFNGKSTIYIFRNVKDFQEYGGGRPGVGGFYMPQSPNENAYPSRVVSAYHGTFGTTGDTRMVLAHEGTHQFQHILCAGSPEKFHVRPAWWMEGLAVYFGDGYIMDEKGNLSIGIPRDRLMVLQMVLKQGMNYPISRFVRLDYRQFSSLGISYPFAWSLCHYFMHRGEVGSGRGRGNGTQQAVEIAGKKVMLNRVFKQFFEFVLAEPPDPQQVRGQYGEYYGHKLDELLGFPVDRITEDWKAYVLNMELEPLGKLTDDGGLFISKTLAFQIGKASGWQWRQEDVSGREAIRIENPGSTGRIIVTAQGNMDNSSVEELRDEAERGAAQRLQSIYVDESKKVKVAGYDGYEISYEGTEARPVNATRDLKIRDKPQRYRHIVVSTLRRSYEIVMQADQDRFDDNQADFNKILATFQIHE